MIQFATTEPALEVVANRHCLYEPACGEVKV